MTHFITPEFPVQHGGAERIEFGIKATRQVLQAFAGAAGNVGWVRLSILGGALLSLAYGLMDSVEEGHLLAIWMVACAALVAVLAFFAPAAGKAGNHLKRRVDA